MTSASGEKRVAGGAQAAAAAPTQPEHGAKRYTVCCDHAVIGLSMRPDGGQRTVLFSAANR